MTSRTPLACLLALAAFASVALVGASTAAASNTCVAIEATQDPCASMSISKYGPYVVNSGDTAEFTFAVYNTGYENISDVVVTDDHCSPVSGATGDIGDDGILTPYYYSGDNYEVWNFSCSYTITGEPGSYVDNIAHVQGVANENPVSADSYAHRTYISGLQVSKAVDLADADPWDVLHYTITVSNVGPDSSAYYQGQLEDEGCVDLQRTEPQAAGFNNGFQLAPGESVTYTCHY